MTAKKTFYRQGDIVLVKEDRVPATSIKKDNIIARGEHSGHAHQFTATAPVSVFIDPATSTQHVHVEHPAVLEHDTHENHELAPGDYEVRVERELDLVGEVRRVAD